MRSFMVNAGELGGAHGRPQGSPLPYTDDASRRAYIVGAMSLAVALEAYLRSPTRTTLLGIAEDRIVPTLARLAENFDHYMLDLRVFLKGVHLHILANAAFLVSTMRHL